MLALVGYLVAAVVLYLGAAGVASGVADAVEGMTRHARSATIDQVYLEQEYDRIEEYQSEGTGAGMMQALAGGAQAALNAETLSTPDPSPVGLGFGTGITVGYAAGEVVDEHLTDDEQTSGLGPADTPLAPGFDGATPVPPTRPDPAPPPEEVTSEVVSLAEVAGYYAVDPATVGFTYANGDVVTSVTGGITIGTDGSVSGMFSAWRERQSADGAETAVSDLMVDSATLTDVAEVQDGVYTFSVELVEELSYVGGEETSTNRGRFVVGMGEMVMEGSLRFVLQ